MAEALFDLSAEYEEMLNRGIRLSGEDRDFFIRGRVRHLAKELPAASAEWRVRRILDFGCGTGNASSFLAATFPGAEVVGVDTAANALEYAARKFGAAAGNPRAKFRPLAGLADCGAFEVCYVNGVFHHILAGERQAALGAIRAQLVPGGFLALFENNPWNPGTRMVMSRIPFDRDAQTIAIPAAQAMVREAGFEVVKWASLFYFPRALGFLRFAEPALSVLPWGAQYCVMARREPQ